MAEPIEFKVEHSLFLSLEDGTRSFDMRWWDIADDRIYAMSWSRPLEPVNTAFPDLQAKVWEAEHISFRDKETDEVLTFFYKGVEFPEWAPAWGFIQLGERVNAEGEEPTDD